MTITEDDVRLLEAVEICTRNHCADIEQADALRSLAERMRASMKEGQPDVAGWLRERAKTCSYQAGQCYCGGLEAAADAWEAVVRLMDRSKTPKVTRKQLQAVGWLGTSGYQTIVHPGARAEADQKNQNSLVARLDAMAAGQPPDERRPSREPDVYWIFVEYRCFDCSWVGFFKGGMINHYRTKQHRIRTLELAQRFIECEAVEGRDDR